MEHLPAVVGFHSLDTAGRDLPAIVVAGHEWRTPADGYDFDCRTRKDPHYVFQFTVSGEGEIEVNGRWHRLPPGRGFLIEVPGPFHYRLPANCPHWELKYVSLSLACLPWWSRITSALGRLVDLPVDHPVVQRLSAVCEQASAGQVRDAFHNSVMAYEFLMEMYRLLFAVPGKPAVPSSVHHALQFMEAALHEPIGLAEIAAAAAVSKFHLIRLFRDHVGESPTRRLIKLRIARAAQLLVETALPIGAVARQTGFGSANYFAKSFRKWLGVSPTAFRSDAHQRGLHRIHIT